ncbi:MAG: hypothetical protein HY720_22140 [Planctomycetes bacterium]|nr:hypothetical protein [Planctomycetota bacterium]
MTCRQSLIVAASFFLLAPVPAFPQEAGTITGKIENRWHSRDPEKYAILVYVAEAPGDFQPPATPPVVDQIEKVYVPHVLAVVRGTTVTFRNSDSIEHNTFSPSGDGFDLGNWMQGEERQHQFEKLGVHAILCKLHPEMSAFVIILQNPYFAWVDKDGSFTIPNVPAGSYELKVWGEKIKDLDQTESVEVPGSGAATVEWDVR